MNIVVWIVTSVSICCGPFPRRMRLRRVQSVAGETPSAASRLLPASSGALMAQRDQLPAAMVVPDARPPDVQGVDARITPFI